MKNNHKKIKFCKVHKIPYVFVCSECLAPFLKHTSFKSLDEIREYQIKNAKKVNLKDKMKIYNRIGVIMLKISGNFAFSGILLYDIENHKILRKDFKSTRLVFNEYFPSVLFLNYLEPYLELINSIEYLPDCYIVNASGQIHPFRYGLACELGLRLNCSVIGYTKKLLYGKLNRIEDNERILGVFDGDDQIGFAFQKPKSKKYFYVSVGNNISLNSVREIFIKLDWNIFSKLSNELSNFAFHNRKINN